MEFINEGNAGGLLVVRAGELGAGTEIRIALRHQRRKSWKGIVIDLDKQTSSWAFGGSRDECLKWARDARDHRGRETH